MIKNCQNHVNVVYEWPLEFSSFIMVKRKTLAMLDDKYEKHETAIHDSCQDDHLDANDALNCDTDIY